MAFTPHPRRLLLALTFVLLFATACSSALPPVIRGPEAPEATQPAPAGPTQPAQPVVATAEVAATVEATGAVTETVTVEASPAVTETVAVEPTPAITAITGQVVYKQRIALADDAVVEVSLQDASRADAPAVTLGSQTIETKGAQVPIPFAVEYDLSQIDPAGLYTLRATIKEGGELTWTSTEIIPVITRGAATDQVDILVQPVNAAQGKAEMGTLEGTVTYAQRIALPDNAVVDVTLEDISRADAPATVIAQQTIETNGKQVPIEFALQYDPAVIDPAARYAVRARITVDGKLAWTSDTVNPVLTHGGAVNNVEIVVVPVTGAAQSGQQQGLATLQGTVTYLQRIALSPDAIIEVQLQDVSRADAAATVIASQTIETKGAQVPVPFALQYDPAAINPAARISLQARITEGGKLTWINTTMIPVLTNGAPTDNVEILVQPVGRS